MKATFISLLCALGASVAMAQQNPTPPPAEKPVSTVSLVELKDVQIYLNVDWSEDAVKSLSGTNWKLGNRSRSVVASIGDVNDQIDRTVKSLPKK